MGPCEAFINFKEKQQVALCHLLYVVLVLIIVLGLPFTKKKKFLDVYGNWNSLH